MDRTELLFKLGLDLVLIVTFWSLLYLVLAIPWIWATAAALLVAHTLNFLFNGQLWSVLKCFHRVRHSRAEFDEYLCQLVQRIKVEPSIQWAAVYGSLARGEWTEHSDLDLRLVRRPGLWNGLRASWFLMTERTRALVCKFPLDALLLDSPEKLSTMRADEVPLGLLEPDKNAPGATLS